VLTSYSRQSVGIIKVNCDSFIFCESLNCHKYKLLGECRIALCYSMCFVETVWINIFL